MRERTRKLKAVVIIETTQTSPVNKIEVVGSYKKMFEVIEPQLPEKAIRPWHKMLIERRLTNGEIVKFVIKAGLVLYVKREFVK